MNFVLLVPFCFILTNSFPTALNQQVVNPELSEKYQGDIILDDNEQTMIREKRGAPDVTDPNRKWPRDQVISYRIQSGFDANFTSMIRDAFQFWTDHTCLTYQENGRTSPYLRVFNGGQCASGRKSGAAYQEIILGYGCNSPGTIQHEIAHSMGLQHSQSRFDRDSFITLNVNNINRAAMINFQKMTPTTNNNFGVPYDYSSVMHYDDNAQFSMGQRDRAAFSDILIVNYLYDCANKCSSPSIKCQNGGIINSKTCNSCICPFMFTGSDCTRRHPGRGFNASQPNCGSDLTASSSWQNLQGSVGAGYAIFKENLSECYWNIKAPKGRRIEVRLNYSGLYCENKCYWNGMELFMRGFTMGGYRFCCMDVTGKLIESTDNFISIRAYSTYSIAPVNVDYQIIRLCRL